MPQHFFILGDGISLSPTSVGQGLYCGSSLRFGKFHRPPDLTSHSVLQIVIRHPVVLSPNWLLHLSPSLGCCRKSAPSSLFSSMLAPPLHYLAFPPSCCLGAVTGFLDSGIKNLAKYFLAPLSYSLNIVVCALHFQVYPSPCLHSPEFLSLRLVLLQYGHSVPLYNLCASNFLLLRHLHLPFCNLVIRPCGTMPIQNHSVFTWLVGKGDIYDGFSVVCVPPPVFSGSAISSTQQLMIIYNTLPVCRFPPFCAPQDPASVGGIDDSQKHHAASPLSDDYLPVQLRHWSLSCVPCFLNINIYDPYHFLSPPIDIKKYYIVAYILAQVYSHVHCNTGLHEHCHSHPLSLFNVILAEANFDACSFSGWFLKPHHINCLFHRHPERGHSPYIWPGAVELFRSKLWGRHFPIASQVQWCSL